jgi:hypothetical protein
MRSCSFNVFLSLLRFDSASRIEGGAAEAVVLLANQTTRPSVRSWRDQTSLNVQTWLSSYTTVCQHLLRPRRPDPLLREAPCEASSESAKTGTLPT